MRKTSGEKLEWELCAGVTTDRGSPEKDHSCTAKSKGNWRGSRVRWKCYLEDFTEVTDNTEKRIREL